MPGNADVAEKQTNARRFRELEMKEDNQYF
jgi:hypothetical protein